MAWNLLLRRVVEANQRRVDFLPDLPDCAAMNAREWIDEFAARLGVDPPSQDEFTALLDLAGEAAHSSERVAAPAATWVAAKAGREPADALAVARGMGGSA